MLKNKISREQLAPVLGLGVVLILAITGGWIGLGRLSQQLEVAEQMEQKRQSVELASLLGRTGGMITVQKDLEDMSKFSQQLGKMEDSLVSTWHKGWEEASGVGAEWSSDPGKWKDKLVKDNDDIMSNCGRPGDLGKVAIADNFYLGFEEYRQKSPSNEQVPALARQLSVARKLVDLLILAKKTKEGYATPCTLLKLEVPTGSDAPLGGSSKTTKAPNDSKADLFLRESYRVEILCSPEVLYQFIHLINEDPWLFIVKDLKVVNERETFPKRQEIAKLFTNEKSTNTPPIAGEGGQGSSRGQEGSDAKPKLLLVLSGKERLEASLLIDYIGWKILPGGEKSSGTKQ